MELEEILRELGAKTPFDKDGKKVLLIQMMDYLEQMKLRVMQHQIIHTKNCILVSKKKSASILE